MTVLAISLFIIGYLVAIAGIFLPILPGVPVAAVGAVAAAWIIGFDKFGLVPLLLVLALTGLAIALDYVAGLIGAKQFGASRSGLWGSIIGSLLGLFFFPPFGMLIGALAGAVVAELLIGRKLEEAVKSGFGVLIGTLGGMLVKILIIIAIGIVVFPRLF